MTEHDFDSLHGDLANVKYRKTLKDLSQDAEHENSFCLDGTSADQIDAIDVESVMQKWYNIQPDNKSINSPCRCDALYLQGKNLHLIEFKASPKKKNIKKMNLFRKIYDSAIALVEKNGDTFPAFRKHLFYIVVASYLSKKYQRNQSAVNQLENYTEELIDRPWENGTTDFQLHLLNGVLYVKGFIISPEKFAQFAREKNWE